MEAALPLLRLTYFAQVPGIQGPCVAVKTDFVRQLCPRRQNNVICALDVNPAVRLNIFMLQNASIGAIKS